METKASDRRDPELLRKHASVMQGAFTMGEHASEFADEMLDLVDRSNTVELIKQGCPIVGAPPHGVDRRGVHPHGKIYRRAHFVSTGLAHDLTHAAQLQQGYECHDAVVRISNFVLPLDRPDVMGFAVKLPSEHGNWDLIATSARRFIAGNLAAFRAISSAPVARHAPRTLTLVVRGLCNGVNPAALLALPRARARWFPGRPSRYATTYWGVHTFRLVGRDGELPFKFRWQPVSGEPGTFGLWLDIVHERWKHLLDPSHAPRRRIGSRPSSTKRSIHAGTLSIDLADNGTEERSDRVPDHVLFLPTRVPAGIGLTDDEILFARGGAYQLSYLRRTQGEPN